MPATGKKRILMIDDDEDDFYLVNALLQDISPDQYTLEWASSYNNGLKAIATQAHDLYLVDYRLGSHTGIDVLKYFRQLDYNAPVILFTGKGDYLIDKEAMEAGASDYLVKSEINGALLERAIRYTLDKFAHLSVIEKSEKRYFSIFEKSNDIILLVDDQQRIIAANPAAVKVLGYGDDHLYHMCLSDLIARDEDKLVFASRSLAHHPAGQLEYLFQSQAGLLLEVMMNISLLDEKNEHYLCIIQDVTLQKQKAREKQQQEKFAITGRIARMVAHEVRNPLTNILLATSQLKMEPMAESEEGQLYLDIMERNCHRINQLVTELLQSTKMVELTMQPVNINDMVEKALVLASDRLQLNSIQVNKNFTDTQAMMMADEEKLIIALLNIIINGIEAMSPSQGVLAISTDTDKYYIQLRITDNGSGISDENMSKLFEPFFTSKTKGTGLGLTATQNIILNHKGRITVKSKPGEGSSFFITFPRIA
ncbi:hybrid sensor histidine kinase/response regulator [Chitinophaga sp. Cy-1792]|uniref:hybrid sensor histidine kinase/response regulator n=1 Tax=Chitinophaga sp. Cy-1792 TaxID=2608339 RepID=UPI00141D819A|nr:hybrid sensor histidine kinase/response regulator [Chitinophaga sp. Cy-1792]NIG53063.1 response regulator [Chitinophaga sp. Cy-1792]